MNATPNPNVIKLFNELLATQKNSYIVLRSIKKKISTISLPMPSPKPPAEPEVIEEVLKKQQVIELLKISNRTYYRHIENGILVPRQLGKQNYFYHSDLVEALEYSKVHGYL